MSLLPFVLGAALAAQAVMGSVMLGADAMLRAAASWPPIVVRAAGSWLAAIGILSLALGLRNTN